MLPDRANTGCGRVLTLLVTLWLGVAPHAAAQCNPQELSKLLASDAATQVFFGGAVAIDGNTAVVTSPFGYVNGIDTGIAYVFVRTGSPGSEVWTEHARLTASDGVSRDLFGQSAAISGDTVLIGAFLDRHPTGPGGITSGQGSAYVFVKPTGGWTNMTETAKLTASDAAVSDFFGYAVGLSGDTAVVGAYYDNHNGGIDAGSAYVFVRSAGVWTEQAKLIATDAAPNDEFGYAVAISGETVVVGAIRDDIAGMGDAGSVYVFVRAGTVWTQQAKLTASDAGAADQFGHAVAIAGETAVVGAWGDVLPGGGSGSAYVFARPPGGWVNMTQTAKLTASDAAMGTYFGQSVTVAGDTVVVGRDHDSMPSTGSAYVFHRPNSGWATMTETDILTASDAADNDQFGYSVALSGDTVIVGAWQDDHPDDAGSGSAYIFGLDCPIDCPADYDNNGIREVVDIFAFLSGWFANDPAAYEFGGAPGVPAIFAFLSIWFAGC